MATKLQEINGSRDFPGGSAVKALPAAQEPRETQVRSLGWEDLLEEGMATHSSILAWEILWTEEPGGLQSVGSRDRWWWWQPPDVPPQCHWTVPIKVVNMVHFIIYIRVLLTQHLQLFATPWPVACQAPLSMGFSRQENGWVLEWIAIPSPRYFPDLGIKSRSPALQADSLPSEPPGKPIYIIPHTHTINQNLGLP